MSQRRESLSDAKIQAVFELLAYGKVGKGGPYRLGNLKRAARRYVVRNGRMFTAGEKTVRACVVRRVREFDLRMARDDGVARHWLRKAAGRLKDSASWPGCTADAWDYARPCDLRQRRRRPMNTAPYAKSPFRLAAVDLKQLPPVDGLMWMSAAVRHYAKFVEAKRLPEKRAETYAECLPAGVFARYGFVRYVIADRGGVPERYRSGACDEARRFTAPYKPVPPPGQRDCREDGWRRH